MTIDAPVKQDVEAWMAATSRRTSHPTGAFSDAHGQRSVKEVRHGHYSHAQRPRIGLGGADLPGFTDVFASRFIEAGDVRLHAVIGGDGPPLLLVHGWPQTWYAWRMVMPALAREFTVIASTSAASACPTSRGRATTRHPSPTTWSRSWTAWATQVRDLRDGHRDAHRACRRRRPCRSRRPFDRLGSVPSRNSRPRPPRPAPGPRPRLWHLAFNQLQTINEQLVTGREAIFFGAEFAASAWLWEAASQTSLRRHRPAGGRRGGPSALGPSSTAPPTPAKQNDQRITTRLTLPVLAMGGSESGGMNAEQTMRAVADDVQGAVLPSGHRVAEQAPTELLEAVTAFLVLYRDDPGVRLPEPDLASIR